MYQIKNILKGIFIEQMVDQVKLNISEIKATAKSAKFVQTKK